MITRKFNLFLNSGGEMSPVIHVNQYDSGEQWLFTLYDENGSQYIPSSGAIVGIKSDDKGILNTGSVDSQGRIVINETKQMTAAAGKAEFELLIDSSSHGTANFIVDVEKRPGDNADLSDSDLSLIQEAIEKAGNLFDVTDEDVQAIIVDAISDYLDAHPEAISTITDGSITAQKLASGSVTMAKLANDVRAELAKYADGMELGDDGKLYLTHNGAVISDGITIATDSGLQFKTGRIDDAGYMHLVDEDGNDIDDQFDPFFIGSGGGGGSSSGSRLVFSITSPISMSILESDTTATITGNFTSVDTETSMSTGSGSLSIIVGGVVRENRTLEQGAFSVDVRRYLNAGANQIRLVITDSYGATATRNISITVEAFNIAWNLENTIRNTGTLMVYITPSGSGEKTIKLYVDGNLYDQVTVSTSGRRISFSVDLNDGAHTVEAYAEMVVNGVTVPSDHLYCAVAQTSESSNTVVVAAVFAPTEVDQFTTVNIPYRVIDPKNNPADVSIYINDSLYTSESVDQSEHQFSYRPSTGGSLKIEIKCGNASWSKTITVNAISSDIGEITQDMLLKFDPAVITNLPSWSNNGATLTLSSGFDTHNGGLVNDSDGVRCLRVIKGDRVTINYNLFGRDLRRSGGEIELIYKIDNSSAFNAEAISCMSGGIGLNIRANDISFASEQTTLNYPTCEGYKTELKINVEPDTDNKLIYFWEKGTPAKAITYAANDNFIQSSPVGITIGSDDCDVSVYMIRVYSRDLTRNEILANFIVDGKDANEIVDRHDRNQIYDQTGRIDPDRVANLCPDLHVITWHAAGLSESKEQKITGILTHKYVNGGAAHSWTASNVEQKAQGTSSLGYVQSGCNEDFNCKDGFTLDDGTHIAAYSMSENAIGVNYFNFKTNVASQEHVNNILLSEWYNRFQPYTRAAKAANNKVRDTVEGHMSVFFFHNTGSSSVQVGPYLVAPDETILYSLGCFNNSKKNNEVFEYDDIVIELRNNIAAQVRFKSDDLSGEDWSGDVNFEFRYLNEDKYSEAQAQAIFQNFLTWMVSCDADSPSNSALPSPVTINGIRFTRDDAEYRKAKFAAEAANHMEIDSFLWHYLITLVFSQVDNRAKNVFLAYNSTTEKWNVVFGYDNDTGMGNDNEGGLTLKYGYMDTDNIGTRAVFNAADSALWAMFRYCFADEIRNMYISRENAGAWDLDYFADYCDQNQDYACESLWIEDVWRKDIDTLINLGTSAYIPMLNGKKRLQRRQFLHFQRAFMSSYFIGSAYAVADSATIRGYTPDVWNGVEPASVMSITPYSDLWVTVRAGSADKQIRAVAGETVTIDLGESSMNDTEIYVRNASFIQDLGALACLYPGYIDISNCRRLKRAEIGSSIVGYQNTNLSELSVLNAVSLEYINVERCPNLAQELNLSNNIMIKECYTKGSGVTGITFAEWGRLVTAQLNAVASIYAHNLSRISEFSLESMDSIVALNLEDTPFIETVAFITAATNLARVRLMGINWRTVSSTYNLLKKLYGINGIDDDGYSTAHGVVTGSIYFDSISQSRLNELNSLFDRLTITYGTQPTEYTVKFYSDEAGTVVGNQQKVAAGEGAVDPVAAGLMDTPTKESDIEWVYPFYGWDASFDSVYSDLDIKPTFSREAHKFTVTFLGANGETVYQSTNLAAHSKINYEGPEIEKTGEIWMGWDQETALADITDDLVLRPVFSSPVLPSSVKDLTNYDYAYSDDPDDNSAYTFGELYAIINANFVSDYLPYGAAIRMKLQTAVNKGLINSANLYTVFTLHGIGFFELADGGASHADFFMRDTLNNGRRHHETNTTAGGWETSEIRAFLNTSANSLYSTLPSHWKKLIKSSVTRGFAGNTDTTIVEVEDYLRLMSAAEAGTQSSATYRTEVYPNAPQYTFPVYTSNASRVKKSSNGTGGAQYWWTRTPTADSSSAFQSVVNSGYGASSGASNSNAVVFGFSC